MIYVHLVLNQGSCIGFPKSMRHQQTENHHFVEFYQEQEHLPTNQLNFVTNYSNHLQIKYSFSFVEEVLKFDASLFMASFDIKSLFTDIPITKTLNLYLRNLYRNQTRVGNLNKSSFYSLLKITMFESFYKFDGKFRTYIS